MSEKKGLFSWFDRKSKKQNNDVCVAEKIEVEPLAAQKSASEPLATQKSASEALVAHKSASEPLGAQKSIAEKDKVASLRVETLAENNQDIESLTAEKLNIARLKIEKRASENKGVAQSCTGIGDEYIEVIMFDHEPAEDANISEEKKSLGFWTRFKKSLSKTHLRIGSGLFALFKNKKIDDELFEELEDQLILADLGVDTTMRIIDKLTDHVDRKNLKNSEVLYKLLKADLLNILLEVDQVFEPIAKDINGQKIPFVILMVGVNGVGKTTTIGKLAKQYQQQGKSVMLAAGDTFRAAAVEQLQVWGERNEIPVIAQQTGSDSASVLFDAMDAAKARGIDVLLADTAGRLQNKDHLMNELHKIVRIMRKKDSTAPHEIMLTIDAGTGQNAMSQVKLFNQAIGLTGLTLTKLDGTAKGGIIFSIADKFKLPIRYIGTGEGINDLRKFKAQEFIDALFDKEDERAE